MRRGMLIDAEHMSERSLRETLGMAEAAAYPIMLSHAWFRELKLSAPALGQDPEYVQSHWNEQRSEMHRRADTLAAIRRLGGVVGVVTNQGYVEAPPGSSIANDCDTSSKSFAQAMVYAVQQMGGVGVGLGSDVNGFNGQPGPRFGPLACGGGYADPIVRRRQEKLQRNPIQYGSGTTVGGRQLSRSVAGERQFDFNAMGLAHYGMIPDLIADLQGMGIPPRVLDTLFHSAAAYLEMWKRAEARSRALSGGDAEYAATPTRPTKGNWPLRRSSDALQAGIDGSS
jgi:microsomal dipeptidase-like Zn-dependent dipeptidase